MNKDNTLIKLGKDAIFVIVKWPTEKKDFEGEFFSTIISLNDYQVICEKFAIPLTVHNAVETCSNLSLIQRMKEPIWSSFKDDGSLDFNLLRRDYPFYEVSFNVPGVKSFAQSEEKITSVTFHHEIEETKKPSFTVIRTKVEGRSYKQIKLINLDTQNSEFKSNKEEMMSMYCPSDKFLLTDKYMIYGKCDLYGPVTLIIRSLSDGSEKTIAGLPNPRVRDEDQDEDEDEDEDEMGAPFMSELLLSTWGQVPGSDILMVCHQMISDRLGNYWYPHGFAVYFVDLKKGTLVGGEDAGIFVETLGSHHAQFKVRLT